MTKEIREDVAILGQSISDEVFEYLLKQIRIMLLINILLH